MFISFFTSPVGLLVVSLLFLSWFCIYGYGKMTGIDESAIEKEIEVNIEKDLENVMNLPSGTLNGKFGFMVESKGEEPKGEGSEKENKK
jgi:E3 ubiquitin-protein ligase DOA10